MTKILFIFLFGLGTFLILNVLALVLWLVHTYFENHEDGEYHE